MVPNPEPSPWLQPRLETIPWKEHPRWLGWVLDQGKKLPRAANRPDRNCNALKAKNWCRWEALLPVLPRLTGPMFALGSDPAGTFSGVDIDDCVVNGTIEPWAQNIITSINSYAEYSPSGTGVKILTLGALPDTPTQRKVFKLEIYDRNKPFTVTGHHLAWTPNEPQPRETALRELFARQQSHDLLSLVMLFGLFKGDRGDKIDIVCPWTDEHHGETGQTDTTLFRKPDGTFTGFECQHGHCRERRLPDVFRVFGLTGRSDFRTTRNGSIISNSTENIRLALEKLGISVSFDAFALKYHIHEGDKRFLAAEATTRRVRVQIEPLFRFQPPVQLFNDVLYDLGWYNHKFHPVKEYLNGLRWDSTPRVDTWLIRYADAVDTPYVRAVSRIVLLAAVRRVREPGCKFDELLVLEGPQGTEKSTLIRTLCQKEEWFSDGLLLGADAQRTIENTSGKWITEAAEMHTKHTAEQVKIFLSRSVDGPCRMAYAHVPDEVPRQFIVIGTTNKSTYLNDPTGARRFWPVLSTKCDIAGLKAIRDQLWAEAAYREAQGESIRLAEDLWPDAAVEQEKRREEEPWEEVLSDKIFGIPFHFDLPKEFKWSRVKDDSTEWPKRWPDYVEAEFIWQTLRIEANKRNNKDAKVVADVMQRLGYPTKVPRQWVLKFEDYESWTIAIDGRGERVKHQRTIWTREGHTGDEF